MTWLVALLQHTDIAQRAAGTHALLAVVAADIAALVGTHRTRLHLPLTRQQAAEAAELVLAHHAGAQDPAGLVLDHLFCIRLRRCVH